MKKLILIITLLALFADTYAQGTPLAYKKKQYNEMMQKGKQKTDSTLYFDAYDKFRKAEYWGSTDKEKQAAALGMEQSIAHIKKEKEMLDSLLTVAQEMQRKVETAMFDKAVKERNKEWKGYANYDWNKEGEKKAILEKIDSLDLSNNALLRIPREVAECPNLKHVNLLGNNEINWKQSEETLSKLKNVNLYVSVYDLGDIAQAHWHKIKGVDLKQHNRKPFSEIPQNILAQQQLSWLKIDGDYFSKNTFSQIPQELFTMQHLQHLELTYSSIDTLPAEIGNLTNLTSLDLSVNNLTSIPSEIGNLTNLISLDLGWNKLTSLPAEIGNLTNLTSLELRWNKLISLPAEIGNLTNLTELYLGKNPFIDLPDSIIYWDIVKWDEDDIKYFGEIKNFELAKKIRTAIQKRNLKINYQDLSWWCTFAHDFEGAIWAGLEYMKQEKIDVGGISNLGLGYLWNGDFEKAKELYLKYKEELYEDGKGKDVFYTDILDVLQAGIKPKNCQYIIEMLKLLEVEIDKNKIQTLMPDCYIKW